MDSDNLFRNLALIYVEQFNLSRHISEGDWATSFFPFLLIYLFLSYWSVWVPRCGFALSPILPEICIASKISSLRNSLSLFGNVTLKTYLYKLTTLSTILINFYKLWTPSTIIFNLHMKLKPMVHSLFLKHFFLTPMRSSKPLSIAKKFVPHPHIVANLLFFCPKNYLSIKFTILNLWF